MVASSSTYSKVHIDQICSCGKGINGHPMQCTLVCVLSVGVLVVLGGPVRIDSTGEVLRGCSCLTDGLGLWYYLELGISVVTRKET